MLGVCLPGYGASANFVFSPFEHIRFKGCECNTFFTPSINYKFGPTNQNDGEFSLPIFGHSEGFPCPGRRDNEKMVERLSKSDGGSGRSLQNYQNGEYSVGEIPSYRASPRSVFSLLTLGRVAQRITRLTTDQKIAGSNPAAIENFL